MSKVVLIGCGNVGMAYAFSVINNNYGIKELVLIDADKDKLKGKVMDLKHSLANLNLDIKVKAGEYFECKDADIVCITAGPSQNSIKKSRLEDLYKANEIFKEIIPQIKDSGFNGIYLIASNPLDVITYMTWKYSGIDYKKVIGSGTLLDTARLKSELSDECKKDKKDITGYVLGEHGDSQFVAWSNVNVNLDNNKKEEIAKKVKGLGFEVSSYQGFTCYGIGSALSRITKAILFDEKIILPVSSYIKDLDVFISTPSIVGKEGVIGNMKIKLETDETVKLMESVYQIKSSINEISK